MQQMQANRPNNRTIRVALLGVGTVGSQVARMLMSCSDVLSKRVGARLELVAMACRHPQNIDIPDLPMPIDKAMVTQDTASLCMRDDIDMVVELIGGVHPAYELVQSALEHGKSVVTANKALLAQFGPELYACAKTHGVDLYAEAAVAGAIPIVRPLQESLIGDNIQRIVGIVNGTTNYILDEMTVSGLDFASALAQAQEKGYAEADPTGDIEGFDAANKAAILAMLAFQMPLSIHDVHVEGVSHITALDIAAAQAEDKVIKLLAVVERIGAQVNASVYPALVSKKHPLASVHGSYNAVLVHAQHAGDLMFYGRGAGGAPTACAVMGDVVSAARHCVEHSFGPSVPLYENHAIVEANQIKERVVLRCQMVQTGPAFVGEVMDIVEDYGIKVTRLASACQGQADGECAYCGINGAGDVRLLLEEVTRSQLAEIVPMIEGLDCVEGTPLVLRLLDE